MYSNAVCRKLRKHLLAALGCVVILGAAAQAQNPDRVVVPLTDPARPAMVHISVLNGGIVVKTHAGPEVIVEARLREREDRRQQGTMRRIPMTTTGLSVEEENNTVRVGVESHSRTIDLVVSVPANASLKLNSVNDGNIEVTGVSGEIDVNNTNGDVSLKNIAGNAVAHALNGDIKVSFASVNDKPMAFSSMNGDIDVTFPAGVKANIVLTNNQGDVYSDFDLAMQTTPPQAGRRRRPQQGRQVQGEGRPLRRRHHQRRRAGDPLQELQRRHLHPQRRHVDARLDLGEAGRPARLFFRPCD